MSVDAYVAKVVSMKITTPKGKRLSIGQYLGLQHAVSNRTGGGGPSCEHGHFDCAVWEGGPCSDELRDTLEDSQTALKQNAVPADFPVRPLRANSKAEKRMTCGTCGLSWDDAVVTSMTPAPSGRCPFEHFHK